MQYQVYQASLEKFGKNAATEIWDQALTYCHFNLHDSSLVQRPIGKPNKGDGSRQDFASFADFCKQCDIALLAAAPLSMGLLTHNPIADWHPALGSKLEEACQSAAAIAKANSVDIVTLALLYAMSHPKIPCTILGMKDIDQVDKAAALAHRFHLVDWNAPNLTQQDVLRQVLTESEMKVYQALSDTQNGPFAGLEETRADGFVPQYQWDGVEEAHKFWQAVDGAKFEKWQWR